MFFLVLSGDEIFWRKRRMSSTLAGVASGLENHSAMANLTKRLVIILNYLDYCMFNGKVKFMFCYDMVRIV